MRGKAAKAVPAQSNTTKHIATSTLIVRFMVFSIPSTVVRDPF
jgi:hypothetical protein